MHRIITLTVVASVFLTSNADTLSRPETTFAFAGDIMMGTTYPDTSHGAYMPPNDGNDLFCDAADIFRNADVAAANQEGTLLDTGGKAKDCFDPNTCFTFRTPTNYVRHLVDCGMDFMSIANNHINDFGPIGTASTQLTLKTAGIAYAGLREQCPTAIIVRNGKRIGFAAFGHSRGTSNLNNLDFVRSTVSELAKEADIVVVSFHGGAEGAKHTRVPRTVESAFGEQRGNVMEFAHAAIDAGADIVYGHGPHVNRAMELYKDRLIMYSLGNFCTPYRMNISGLSGYAPIVEVNVDPEGRFISGQIHPFIQQKGIGPRRDTSGVVIKNLRALTALDFPDTPLDIADNGAITIR
ncbi:MAG: CapA family protein [Muribaculaceae bacterium]|nr:CapA family protein [Muribaculaceae bacterium]